MANPLKPVVIKKGEALFYEKEASKSIFLIRKGTVSIRKKKGVSFIEVARVGEKEVLGELGFFDRMPRSASAIAMTTVEAQEIPFESLDKVWIDIPDYMKTIIVALAERLRRANDQIRRLQQTAIAEETATDLASPGDGVAVDDLDEGEKT